MIPTELQEWLDADTYTQDGQEHGDLIESLFHDEFSWSYKPSDIPAPDGWTCEKVDSYGGEGQGETYYTVYKFSKEEQEVYIYFDGWYQSYHGSEFSEYFEVVPQEVKRIEYNRVK